ncbi:MAG: hypothetical protein NTV94_18730 [Planctomycetota bacterium]|nr:hypothetical protein [Planctomycetota bacterium]
MPTPDPDKLIRLAAPLLESWMQQDHSHRALIAELAAYLTQLSTDPRRGVTSPQPVSPPPIAPKPAPPPPHSLAPVPAAARNPAKPAAARIDPIDQMIAHAQVELPRLVGGLSPPPPSAPGVAIPAPPPPPPTPAPTPRLQPNEGAQREMFLATQKAAHHRDQMRKCLKAKDHAAAADHIGRAATALDTYISKGGTLQPGDEARDLLTSIIEELPEKLFLSATTEKLLDRIFHAADAREEEDDGPTAPPHPAAAARPILAGRTAILIGGDIREARRAALESDLGLAELRWIRSTPTNPATRFEPDIKRAEVDVVLIAIRWVRHATAWAAADAAAKFKKPLVRLPGGLGSNAVAHEILEQAAEKLRR